MFNYQVWQWIYQHPHWWPALSAVFIAGWAWRLRSERKRKQLAYERKIRNIYHRKHRHMPWEECNCEQQEEAQSSGRRLREPAATQEDEE